MPHIISITTQSSERLIFSNPRLGLENVCMVYNIWIPTIFTVSNSSRTYTTHNCIFNIKEIVEVGLHIGGIVLFTNTNI